MKLRHILFATAAIFVLAAGLFNAAAQPSNTVATAPVFVPDYTHAGEPLPDGVLAWDELTKAVDATNEQDYARFTFSFTNVTAEQVVILSVHPSCGCTTAELPPVPWLIAAGASGQIKLSVNLQGKSGSLFKTVNVATDKGKKDLILRINILPPPPMPEMSEAQRDAGIAAAKADRQAVFKNDCATCHEAKNRATMVPDLHNLQVPTSEEFWRTWITAGKAGSLMPAFATSQGGPLNDLQIASLAAYLNAINPSHVPPPAPAAK